MVLVPGICPKCEHDKLIFSCELYSFQCPSCLQMIYSPPDCTEEQLEQEALDYEEKYGDRDPYYGTALD